MALALRLAKGGYWGGDPEQVLRAPADQVVLAMHYEDFTVKYENEMHRLNTEQKA